KEFCNGHAYILLGGLRGAQETIASLIQMIPREILKKIRRIGFPTNRRARRRCWSHSFQASPEVAGIAAAVENGDNRKYVVLNREVDVVCIESFEANFPRSTADSSEKFRLAAGPSQRSKNFLGKLTSQARIFVFIP